MQNEEGSIQNKNSTGKAFVKGAAILGIAGLIVKLLGAVFRLPLASMIGATGMAYYSPAYYTYTVFVVIATSGIPVAISKLIAESITIGDFEEGHRVFRISFWLMFTIGAISFVIMFFGAGKIAAMQGIEEAKLPMMAVAPALLICPVLSAYRGYYQGIQNMMPTAISQVIEQVVRVFFGLGLGYLLFHEMIGGKLFSAFSPGEKGAAGAAFGATLGAAGGLAILLFIFMLGKKAYDARRRRSVNAGRKSNKTILKQIAIIAVPITLGAAITPIMNLVEVPVVMKGLLNSGWDPEVAKNLYGQISGLAVPIINMPQVLTMALAMSLVPAISACHKMNDKKGLRYNTELSVRIATMIGMPCAVGMAVLAEPILLLLYSSRHDEAVNVAPAFAILAIGVIFVSIVQCIAGSLQGVGKQNIPVINMFIGIVIKIVVTYFLVSQPSLNIKGAAIGTLVAYIIVAILNIRATKKYTGARFDIMLTYVRPGIATAVMGIVAWAMYYVVFGGGEGNKIACLISILVAAVVYFVMLFVTKSITREELSSIPGGSKINRLLDKVTPKRRG